jgi:hypothetical protein
MAGGGAAQECAGRCLLAPVRRQPTGVFLTFQRLTAGRDPLAAGG